MRMTSFARWANDRLSVGLVIRLDGVLVEFAASGAVEVVPFAWSLLCEPFARSPLVEMFQIGALLLCVFRLAVGRLTVFRSPRIGHSRSPTQPALFLERLQFLLRRLLCFELRSLLGCLRGGKTAA